MREYPSNTSEWLERWPEIKTNSTLSFNKFSGNRTLLKLKFKKQILAKKWNKFLDQKSLKQMSKMLLIGWMTDHVKHVVEQKRHRNDDQHKSLLHVGHTRLLFHPLAKPFTVTVEHGNQHLFIYKDWQLKRTFLSSNNCFKQQEAELYRTILLGNKFVCWL